MKSTTMLLIVVVMVAIVGGFIAVNNKSPVNSNVALNDVQIANGGAQKVILSQEGFNYKSVSAKAGKPISISADNSVYGCLRAPVFNLGDKKYYKYLKTQQDSLELPALLGGTYTFSCSMGMGFGKLIVG